MTEFSSIDEIPKKCIKCLHHKITKYGGNIDYCDYIERWEGNQSVPCPNFYKQDYACKGHEESEVGE